MSNTIKIVITFLSIILTLVALRIYMIRHYEKQLKDNNEGKGR